VLVGDAVDEGHHDVQAGRQHSVELAESFDHHRVLLRHHVDGLEDEYQRNDEEHQRHSAEREFHEHPL